MQREVDWINDEIAENGRDDGDPDGGSHQPVPHAP